VCRMVIKGTGNIRHVKNGWSCLSYWKHSRQSCCLIRFYVRKHNIFEHFFLNWDQGLEINYLQKPRWYICNCVQLGCLLLRMFYLFKLTVFRYFFLWQIGSWRVMFGIVYDRPFFLNMCPYSISGLRREIFTTVRFLWTSLNFLDI
jgi:hypothetical protein